MMKSKILLIILSVFLFLPVYAPAEENTAQYDQETQQAIENIISTQQLDEDQAAVNEEQISQNVVSPYKQPISKKKLIKKFLAAMFGVVVSSLILYLGLSIYNKARDNFSGPVKTPEGETPLETPSDLQDAVKSFLDKTEWR